MACDYALADDAPVPGAESACRPTVPTDTAMAAAANVTPCRDRFVAPDFRAFIGLPRR